MAQSYPQVPQRDDLITLFQAPLRNARDLLDDAQLLADHARWPRAHALATLAWEELSKGHLCVLAMMLTPAEMSSERFWTDFRDHELKLNRVYAFAAVEDPEPEKYLKKIIGQSRATHRQKLDGLYVEYRRGKTLLPNRISEKVARARIKAVSAELQDTETTFPVDRLDASLASVARVFGMLQERVRADLHGLAADFEAHAR